MKKIKAIFFDLGGVVLNQQTQVRLETIAEVFGADKKDLEIILKKYNNDWSTGKITANELAEKLKKEFKTKKSTPEVLKTWREIYQKKTSPNKDLINLIEKLRKFYKIYLLTNTVDLHHDINSKRNIYNHFDGIFASHIIGKRKPEEFFYSHVLGELKLMPSECIFIDDIKENIEGAQKSGIRGIVFQNNSQLIKDFKKEKIGF